ncbi:MAG TPA: hypothetical protein VK718_10500 [Ferruginibacter sp.]|jgi:hypothetical protein|nr:hypothetical protein [Ferruginibacter sp.]
MKKLILFAAVGLGLLLFTSCKKTSSGDITTANTFSATITEENGHSYTAVTNNNAYSDIYIDGTSPLAYYLYAYAYDSTGGYLEVDMDSYYKGFTPRTYGVAGDSTSYVDIYYDSANVKEYYNNVGIVNITSIGATVQGTFSGTLYYNPSDSVKVTNGKFNISL